MKSDLHKRDDGGPAFPRPLSKLTSEEVSPDQDGMSLRDYFAGQALAGTLAAESNPTIAKARLEMAAKQGRQLETQIALECYAVADAMLAERRQ